MPAPRGDKWEQDIELRLAQLEQRASRPLSNTGFSADGPKALTFDGSMHVTGEMDIDGPIDVHGTANFDGDTTIGGNAAITGTLSLPAGIINNDALSNPIVPANAHADASNFSLSTSWATKCSVTVPVPSGFTQALVLAVMTGATAKNTTGSDDFFYASVSISALSGSLPGWVLGSPTVPAGKYGVTQDYSTVLLTGLSGSFTIAGQISTAFASWATDSGNKMNVDASILFLR